jgi:hypothetical protein
MRTAVYPANSSAFDPPLRRLAIAQSSIDVSAVESSSEEKEYDEDHDWEENYDHE